MLAILCAHKCVKVVYDCLCSHCVRTYVCTYVCTYVRLGSLLLLVLWVSLLHRDPSVYGNIMYDRRIVRGNTYALHTLPAVSVCVVGVGKGVEVI